MGFVSSQSDKLAKIDAELRSLPDEDSLDADLVDDPEEAAIIAKVTEAKRDLELLRRARATRDQKRPAADSGTDAKKGRTSPDNVPMGSSATDEAGIVIYAENQVRALAPRSTPPY